MTTTAQCERIHALSAGLTNGIMSITGSITGCSDSAVRTELDAALSHLNAAYRAALLTTCEG